MSSVDTLPVLLVSALDDEAADKIISDICEPDLEIVNGKRIWNVTTKYYTAKIAVEVCTDSSPSSFGFGLIQAHLVYLTPQEGVDVAVLKRRMHQETNDDEVRVVCGEQVPQHEAMAAGYEPVSLLPQEEEDEEDFGAVGIDRVREALLSHTWKGLKMKEGIEDGRNKVTGEESDDEEGWDGEDWERVMEAVSEAAQLPPEQRRHAAELLANLLLRQPPH